MATAARVSGRHGWVACLVALAGIALAAAPDAMGYTRESPEVRAMVDKGKAYLEEESREERLGGRCLIGLVYIKEDQRDHRFVNEAVEACQAAVAEGNADNVYSNGLALIFLSELDAETYRDEIQFFLNAMFRRQKNHGGWGYDGRDTGDTSQTQYGCLGVWEVFQKGIPVNGNSVQGVASWLIATQDPSGAWGYQGKVGSPDNLVEQTEITCSLVSAAMGSLLICADLVGYLQAGNADDQDNPLPSAVQMSSNRDSQRPRLSSASINREHLLAAVRRGNEWMDENYKVELERYTSYYLYALERYKTLQAILDGADDPEPGWYNDGVEYLMEMQNADGSWSTGCGPDCDTAFSILFLIRSMQLTYGSLGEGAALAGRGLPSDIRQLRVRGGKLVAQQAQTELDSLLGNLDDDMMADLDAVISGASTLVMGDVDEKDIRRLKQLVRSGEPAARIVAVKALAQTGSFDHVPTLLYAFAQEDPRLVIEARDGLRMISRRFEGFGLQDNFTRQEQLEVLDRWVQWYEGVRPDVPVVLE